MLDQPLTLRTLIYFVLFIAFLPITIFAAPFLFPKATLALLGISCSFVVLAALVGVR